MKRHESILIHTGLQPGEVGKKGKETVSTVYAVLVVELAENGSLWLGRDDKPLKRFLNQGLRTTGLKPGVNKSESLSCCR